MATVSKLDSPSGPPEKEVKKEVSVPKQTEKTPGAMLSETPDESAARYNLDLSKHSVKQVPSGTHLHPDVADSMLSRGLHEQSTDNALVRQYGVPVSQAFAPDAEYNDKF